MGFLVLWLNGFGIVESELIKRLGWIDWSAAEIVRTYLDFWDGKDLYPLQ